MRHIFPHLPLLLGLGACAIAPARAATLNVPAQYGTIQAAITAAQPGDVVLLADGTYTGAGNVALDFGGKSITVASQNGAAKTIIDCQKQPRTPGVVFHSSEDAAARLQGVTIQNGTSTAPTGFYGAGIAIAGSSPTITGCVLTRNSTNGFGGGLYADVNSHPRIINCVFASNTAREGGGLYALDRVTVTGCTFTGNTALYGPGGGAEFGLQGTLRSVITGCTFAGNTAFEAGGCGVYSYTLNSASLVSNAFTNCVFVGNVDKAVGVSGVSGVGGSGGGFRGTGLLTNCTFTGNTAGAGAAVYSDGGQATVLTNCILFGDSGPELHFEGSLDSVSYSDVQGGAAGTGNANVDPQFVRSPNLTATPADYGDLHLRATSPLLGAGTPNGAPATTLDGVTRPIPPSLGAFEVGPTALPVVADSYVLNSAPAQNFGTATTLVVGGFLGAAYLQFDLTGLSPLSPTSSVKLHLNASRPLAGTSSLVVSATGTGWTETGLTFQNRPALGLPLGFLNVAGGQGATPYDVDATAYVKAQQALGSAQVGLALTQFAPGLPVSIDSKENPAGDGPQLVVTY